MSKILLVEDDNNLREIFEMRLQAEGYQTVSAANGEEGIEVALKERPALIIADIMMPKLSGFEMLETLHNAPEMANTKVIAMTALGQAEDQARGAKLGVVKYLVKSQVTLEDFVRVVREVLQPDQATAPAANEEPAKAQPQLTNKQESEQSMPDDTQPTNPVPADDGGVPSADPLGGSSAPAPSDGVASTDPQSSDEAADGVQGQINDFVASAPAGDAPATDDGAAAPDIPVASPPPAEPSTDGSGDVQASDGTPPADAGGGTL